MRDYQKMSSASFKPAKPIENPEVAQLLDWCLGLGGETGEVLDHVKHAVYHGEGGDAVLITPGFLMETAKELGDVLWYVSAICTTLNISLEDVAKLNELKLQHRYTQGYSNAASADRHQREMALTSLPAYKILQSRIEGDDDAPVNIIVVGPDGAGKTTLIKRLSEVLDMPTVKCDYRTEDKLAETLKRLNTQINVIYDRFFIPDDIVYSAVKHQSHQDYAEAFNLLNQCNPVIIYVTAPLDTLYERSAAWVFLRAQGDEGDSVAVLSVRFVQIREFFIARAAPGCPEIDQHCLMVLQRLGQRKGVSFCIRYRKIRERLSQEIVLCFFCRCDTGQEHDAQQQSQDFFHFQNSLHRVQVPVFTSLSPFVPSVSSVTFLRRTLSWSDFPGSGRSSGGRSQAFHPQRHGLCPASYRSGR